MVQFIEGQMLGRVFLDLGVRGGRMRYEVAAGRGQEKAVYWSRMLVMRGCWGFADRLLY